MNQLWTAALAASAAILASVITQLLTTRREEKLWKRRQTDKVWDLQVALYVELAAYFHRRLAQLQFSISSAGLRPNDWTPGFAGFGQHPREERELLLARAELVATEDVAQAVRDIYNTEIAIEFTVDEGDGEHVDYPGGGFATYLSPGHELVLQLEDQLDEVTAILRKAMHK